MKRLKKFELNYKLIVILLLFIPYISYTQSNSLDNKKSLVTNFVSDGQVHTIDINSFKYCQLHVVFYPKLRYRLVVKSINPNTIIEWSIVNYNNEILFTNTNKAYIRTWDFEFENIMKGKIQFKLKNQSVKKEEITFLVGYQSI